jgi:hypothetical protein
LAGRKNRPIIHRQDRNPGKVVNNSVIFAVTAEAIVTSGEISVVKNSVPLHKPVGTGMGRDVSRQAQQLAPPRGAFLSDLIGL